MRKILDKKKNTTPGREKTPPEKYWDTLVKKVYFVFYSQRMVDMDGFPMWPDWSEQKRGMEASSLKQIITKLRTITEAKGIEWTEAVAVDNLHNFLQKAYNIGFIGKSLLCCVMNKYRDMIICSEYTPSLVSRIIDEWYKSFPQKERDDERDKTAAQIIIGYLKQQYLKNNLVFSDESVMQTVRTIFHHIKQSEFWSQKTLRSCGNNLQGFISELKANKNGNTKAAVRNTDERKPVPSVNNSGRFGKL